MRSGARQLARGLTGAPAGALLWALAAVAAAWFCWRILLPSVSYDSFGFASYYTSARLVLAGELGPGIYDNQWFQARERALGLREDIYGHQPPTMALLLLPVAWLPPGAARAVWLALDLLWLAGIGVVATLLARRAGAKVGVTAVAAMVLLVALYRPLHAELRYAQVYVLLALWYALWLYGFVTGRDWLCGAALAALGLAKLAGAPLWIVMLAAGRWRGLAWAAGLGVAGLIGTLPLVGVDTWRAYLFGRVGDLAANPVFGVTALQTLTSLLRQLFVFDPIYTPAPLLHAPALATALLLIAAVVLVGLTVARARPDVSLLTGAAALCLIVPLQPAGEQHHYVVLLVPFFLLIPLAGRVAREAPAALALAGIALALQLAPNYFLDNAAWSGWPRALLAYPRLYGALALWGAWLLWRRAWTRTAVGR